MTKRRLPPELEEKGETDFNVGLTGDHSERWFSRTDILDWLEHLCGYREENERLRAALKEHEAVLTALTEDAWPPERLAARLARLRTIARNALYPETHQGNMSERRKGKQMSKHNKSGTDTHKRGARDLWMFWAASWRRRAGVRRAK